MPKKLDPNRKSPPRVQIRKELVSIAEQVAADELKDLVDVVNDAMRFYFANAFKPPHWPPKRSETKGE